MAYCVHCGVQLGESEKRCPLCGTEVIDPKEPWKEDTPRAYPVRTPEQELKRNKRYLLTLAALSLFLPAVLCLLIDLLLGDGLEWSAYPSGALMILFISVAVPIMTPKGQPYVSLGTDFIMLSAYLFLVERLSSSGRWFFPIVFPALGIAAVLIALIIFCWRQERLNKVTLAAAVLAAAAVECLGIELLCSLNRLGKAAFFWSPYAVAPCVFISVLLFFINGNRSVREEIRRRAHF